jgi:hypothetical protein
MAKAKPVDDDADDDDLADAPRRVGRPPKPEQFGPRTPEPHERPEYARRLQVILDAVEVPELDRDVRLFLQRIIRRCDVLRNLDAKRFTAKGEETVTILLRAVFESANGAPALILPILRAALGCMHPVWIAKGLRLLEAYDRIDLIALHSTLSDLGLEDQLERALHRKLESILGRPELPQVPTKPPARPKLARPAGVSEETWADIVALRKKPKMRSGRPRRQEQTLVAA